MEIKDKQRKAFEQLVQQDIPLLLQKKSFTYNGRYRIDFKVYPIDLLNFVDDTKDGSVYTTVKTICTITDINTGEAQEFIIDLLDLPIYQELGFKVGGNFKQVLGLYERPAGWTFLKKPQKGKVPLITVNIQSQGRGRWLIKNNNRNYPVISTTRGNSGDSDDLSSISISTFFRAITGYSNSELLELFGYDNPVNLLAFNDKDNAIVEIKGTKTDRKVNSRNDCIQVLATMIFGSRNTKSKDNTIAVLEKKIHNQLFNKSYFSLGDGNKAQIDFKSSFKNRATNKILAEDVHLHDEVICADTILTAEILEKIDNSPVDMIKVLYDGKVYSLRKFSFFRFRALNYYLAETVKLNDSTIEKGTQLGFTELSKLNDSSLTTIKIANDEDCKSVITISRRIDASVLSVENLFTAYSIFADNLNGFDTFDKEYELSNRIITPFDKKALNILDTHLSEITTKIKEGINYIEMSAEEDDNHLPLLNLSEKLKLSYNKGILINLIKDTDHTEGQMSDINNVMSFVSKSYKITADIADSSTTDELIRIQDMQMGRLDLYDAPESKKIGRVHHKTLLMRENEYGYPTAPFYRVNNGVISNEVVYLTAADEENAYVAEWNETFVNKDGSPKKRTLARYNGEVVTVDVSLITLKEYSFLQNVGPTTSCIPFIGNSNGKRLTMSCNQQKQATPTLKTYRPTVNTGGESILNVGKYTAFDIIAMFLDSVSDKCPVILDYKDTIYNSAIRLRNIATANNGDRIYYFIIDAIEDLINHAYDLNTAVSEGLRSIDSLNAEERKLYDSCDSLRVLSYAQIQLPFNYRTMDSGVFSYRLNVAKDEYVGNDIVLHSIDYDIEKYDTDLLVDFGGQKFDSGVFDSGTALGRDYIIAYKTHEGSTIDDAVTINRDLVADDSFTSLWITTFEETLFKDDHKSEIFKANPTELGYFEQNGLPIVGTYLNPGDPVIMKYVTTENKRSETVNKYVASRLNIHTAGQVIATKFYTKNGQECACVTLAMRAEACVGDKTAGRYGNKGVFAQIVPAELMPYDPVTGLTVDMILDPEGIPSRMNISQLLEGLTGLACRKINKRVVISQFNDGAGDYVRELAKSTDTHPVKLIDGRTGLYYERPINVVSLYMYKLVHMARKKAHAVGMRSSMDTVTLQPRKGSKFNGGQVFGEMESWCLEGIGALKVLHELQSVSSDDVKAKKTARRYMLSGSSEFDISGNNNNDLMFQALVRSMCAEVETVDEDSNSYYEFKPLTDEVIRKFASSPIVSEKALHSVESFGNVTSVEQKAEAKSRWGYIELNTEIISPLWLKKSDLNKLFLKRSNKSFDILSKTDFDNFINRKLYVKIKPDMAYLEVLTSEEICELSTEDAAEYTSGFDALIQIFHNYSVKNALTIFSSLVNDYVSKYVERKYEPKDSDKITVSDYLMSLDDAHTEESKPSIDYELEASDYGTATNIKNLKILRFMQDFVDRGANLSDYVITVFPVMSQIFRPEIKMAGINSKPDFDYYYTQIINAAKTLRADSMNNANRQLLYSALAQFMGFEDSNTKYMNLSNWFLGIDKDNDHGKFRSAMQSKVILRSGRAVIVPAADTNMDALHIGIPITGVVVILEEQLISYLTKFIVQDDDVEFNPSHDKWRGVLFAIANQNFNMFRDAYSDEFKEAFQIQPRAAYHKFYKIIKEFVEGTPCSMLDGSPREPQVVLAGRQPSLHQFSVRAYYAKVVNDRAIHVNSLVCKGYNADFDGDQMWYHFPISNTTKREAMEKMSAASNLINPKNGSIILELSQDIALGIYCATMLKDNREELTDAEKNTIPVGYSDVEVLRAEVLSGITKTYEIVSLKHNKNLFISTAGRILFNSLLPDGLAGYNTDGSRRAFSNPLGLQIEKADRFCDLKYDALITSGEGSSKLLKTDKLQDICVELYNSLDDGESLHIHTVEILQTLAKFGFTFSDLFGISISLEDLDEIALNSNKQKHIDRLSMIQSAIEEDYQLGFFSEEDKRIAIMDLASDTMKVIQKDMFASMDRNNNIFIMFDSGARGSKSQIAQTCGAIGMLDKMEGKALETPIISNYHEGMSSFDVQMMSYSARMGMSSTQNKTANAGYATRQSIYMSSGLKIVEWDCGKENWWFDILWDKQIPELSILKPSYKFFKNNLLNRSIAPMSVESIKLFNGTLDGLRITENSYDVLKKKGFHSILLDSTDSIIEVDSGNYAKYVGYSVAECILQDGSISRSHVVTNELLNSGVKKLCVFEPEEITISTESIIGAAIDSDERATQEFKYFIKDGKLTKACVPIIQKKHLLKINTDFGEFNFRYKMTAACRSLLEKREARGLKYLKFVSPKNCYGSIPAIITEKTLDYIEVEGIARIEARILLDCLSGRDESEHGKASHGCCARCYGLKYTNNRHPKIGEYVGIEAAQAVGEPASQLTLSLVNKGGKAGESVASGVELFQRLLAGSMPAIKGSETLVTKNSGYLKIETADESAIVHIVPDNRENNLCKKCMSKNKGICPYERGEQGLCSLGKKVNNARLLHKAGTYLSAGEPLTDGFVLPNDIERVDSGSLAELVRKKQMVWLLNYFNTFSSNNIYINARHFEIFTRLQNFMVLILRSDNPAFKPGSLYEYSEVVGHESELLMLPTTSKQTEVIIQNSGAMSALAFQDVSSVLANLVVKGHKSYRNSPIGSLTIGENLTSGKKKRLQVPRYAAVRKTDSVLTDFGNPVVEFEEITDSNVLDAKLDFMNFDDLLSIPIQNTMPEEVNEPVDLYAMHVFDEVSEDNNSDEFELEKDLDTTADDTSFDSFDAFNDEEATEEYAEENNASIETEIEKQSTTLTGMSLF